MNQVCFIGTQLISLRSVNIQNEENKLTSMWGVKEKYKFVFEILNVTFHQLFNPPKNLPKTQG